MLSSLLERDPGLAAHFPHINHPKIPTIYPPLAQLLFSSRTGSHRDRTCRSSAGGAGDLAIVGMIVLLLASWG